MERYSQTDVISLVEYARDRGIRVMLEIDTPSHTRSWCSGYPDLCPPLPCADGPTRTPLDPSKNSTFDSVQSVFAELSRLLPELLLHTGHDEVDVGCWSSAQNPSIGAWQRQMGFGEADDACVKFPFLNRTIGHDFGRYVYVANRIQDGVRGVGKRPVQWWPGLCLGVSTGNRSCGVPDGFCPCRFGVWG